MDLIAYGQHMDGNNCTKQAGEPAGISTHVLEVVLQHRQALSLLSVVLQIMKQKSQCIALTFRNQRQLEGCSDVACAMLNTKRQLCCHTEGQPEDSCCQNDNHLMTAISVSDSLCCF